MTTKKTIDELLEEPMSFSRADLFARCPREFKLRYLDGMESESGYYAKQGKTLHSAAQVLTTAIKEGADQFSVDDIREKFSVAEAEYFEPGEINISDRAQCIAWLNTYARKTFSRAENIFALEREFSIEYETGRYFRGKIDRIDLIGDDTAEIIDLKSSFAIVPQDELADNVQLNGYGFSVTKILPHISTVLLSHWNFRRSSFNSVTVDSDSFRSFEEWLGRIIKGIKVGIFPARINNYCCYCLGKEECEAYQKITSVKTGKPSHPQTAHEEKIHLAAAKNLIEKRQKEVNVFLESLCNGGDNKVPVDEGELEYSLAEKSKFPVSVKIASPIFAAIGVELTETGELSMSKKAFFAARNKAFESMTEPEIKVFKEQLEEVFVEKKSTGLVCEKPKPEEEEESDDSKNAKPRKGK